MKKYCLMIGILGVSATSAHAIEYPCPERMTVETQTAADSEGFESLNLDTTQRTPDAHFANGISLYSGHPREMAELIPNDEKNVYDRSVWSISAEDRNGYWMACHYTNTSMIYTKKIDENATSCAVINQKTAEPKKTILTCK